MKFFRHEVDAAQGHKLATAIDRFGHLGYAAYFMILEMCYQKLDLNDANFLEKNLDQNDGNIRLTFHFHVGNLRRTLRVTRAKVASLLNLYEELGLLTHELDGTSVSVSICNIMKFLPTRDVRKLKEVSQSRSGG